MELADPKLISALIVEHRKPRKVVAHRGSLASISAIRGSKARRCQCGRCPFCIENDRWERIFKEKFADPNYYEPKPLRVGSSLEWLR